jgi:hypothetical protein
VVPESTLDHTVGQFDRSVQSLGVLEFGPVEQHIGPLIERREIVAGEGVDVRGRPKFDVLSHVCSLSQMKVQILRQ